MADLGFKASRVIITGGTSGIGLGVARAFLEEGAQVGLIGRSVARLDDASASLSKDFPNSFICTASADVGDEITITSAVHSLAERLGGVDHFVANAGIDGEMGAVISDVTAENFRQVFETNVLGVFLSAKAVYGFLVAAPAATLTLIGSDSGFVALPGMLAYNTSKGAIVQLTRALSVEFFDKAGIRVNSICPSIVDTPLARAGLGVSTFDDVDYPVSAPADIAWLVLSLASPRAKAVNGVSLLADYGYHVRSSFPA